MPEVQQYRVLTIGEGETIDPHARIDRGEISSELLDEAEARLRTDEFYDEIDTEAIPSDCVDGRGLESAGPQAAGGTFSLVMADALTAQSYRETGEQAPGHARRFYAAIKQLNKKIGGHDDDHRDGPNCGCGAQDKLDNPDRDKPSILRYITRSGNDIRAFLGAYGVDVPADNHAEIVTRARELQDEAYATNGAELRQATIDVGGSGSIITLPGNHLEAFLVLQTKSGKSFNRRRFAEAFDGRIQAFSVDLPNLQYGTSLLAVSPAEAEARFHAALYYNIATACTLARNLRVIVH